MKPLYRLWIITLLLIIPLPTYAQSDYMIALSNGDLVTRYTNNDENYQITFWGYNGGGILSPDGSKIAFTSYDGTVGEAIANGELFTEFGDLPANIWLMDVASQEFQWVNDQTGKVEDGIYRSSPVWSPDSSRIAWVELNGFPNVYIKTYDLQTGNITTVTSNFSLGWQDAGLYLPRIKWGGGGISRILFNIVGDDFIGEHILEIYNPDTGTLATLNLNFLMPGGEGVVSHHWVKNKGKDVIALLVDNQWGLIDPDTQSYTPLNNSPVLQMVGNNRLQLIPVYTGSYSYDWYVNNSGIVTPLGYNDYSLENDDLPTISPDGQLIAWNTWDGVYQWDNNTQRTQLVIAHDPDQVYNNPGPLNVVWSPMEWVLSTTPIVIEIRPTAVPAQQVVIPTQAPVVDNSCKTPARLVPGDYAILSPGQNNNVRQSWSANSELFGTIYPGEIVYVQDGPVCSEGYNWYLVANDFIYGWTAEGFDGTYWLTANMDFTNCWNSPPARLTPGSKGTVLPGSPNRIRAEPGIGNIAVLGEIPGGGTFFIDGLPVCGDDGRRWYPVTYNGISGWTAEGEGNSYWVQPGN